MAAMRQSDESGHMVEAEVNKALLQIAEGKAKATRKSSSREGVAHGRAKSRVKTEDPTILDRKHLKSLRGKGYRKKDD